MQLVGVQLDIAWENRAANHARVRALLEAHPPPPGSVVALPEMFASGFSMNVDRIAEDESRATENFLIETAVQFGVYVIGGLVTRDAGDGRARNEALVASPERETVLRYAKLHPFSPGREKAHYVAGNAIQSFCVPTGGNVQVAPFICYDLRFPEAFRIATRMDANVLVVIANWPSPRVEHWVTLLRARAIENQAYVLGVNRCGRDPYLAYPGRSMIVDFRGNVLADAGDHEGTISAAIDPVAQDAYRAALPFLDDIRADLLPPL